MSRWISLTQNTQLCCTIPLDIIVKGLPEPPRMSVTDLAPQRRHATSSHALYLKQLHVVIGVIPSYIQKLKKVQAPPATMSGVITSTIL